VNRSSINLRMLPVLMGLLVIVLVLMPGEVGEGLRRFGGVVGQATQQMHDGYMRLFN
jgi:hypothetical protein